MASIHDSKKVQIGALIVFRQDVPKERIEAWVKKLEAEGHAENATVQEFNPDWGSPVWYIP